jgi:DNA-binding CsgD family transcriptional regulator
MARLSEKERDQILALWKAGKSQNSLALDFNVSPATINKLCKGVTQENLDIVNTQVAVIKAIAEKSEYEVNAIQFMVSDLTEFERKSNQRLQAIEDHALSMLLTCERPADVKAIMDVAVKHREARLNKQTGTTINNNITSNEIKVTLVEPKHEFSHTHEAIEGSFD